MPPKTRDRLNQFLRLLEAGNSVSSAARMLEISRGYLHQLKKQDPEFAINWNWAAGIGALATAYDETDPRRKRCSKCRKRRKRKFFHKNPAQKDGLHNWCKACCSEANKRRWAEGRYPNQRSRA